MLNLIQKLFEIITNNYKAALVSMLTTLAIIWSIVTSFGVSPKELTVFLVEQKQTIHAVADELKNINDKIDSAELESHRNQQKMLEIVQRQHNKPGFSIMLNLSSENQDIIRAQLEFGRIYATLVETRTGTLRTHQHLSNLYQALIEVTLDDPLDPTLPFNNADIRAIAAQEGKSVCAFSPKSHICRARKLLDDVRTNISDFPDTVKQNIEIEVYRYLSYCAARALESNTQQTYTNLAEEILESMPSLQRQDPKLYRRQYYWIDYSQLISLVRQGKPGYEIEAMEYFKKLQKGLVSEHNFLKLKLIQHEKLIAEDRKPFWQNLIKAAGAS